MKIQDLFEDQHKFLTDEEEIREWMKEHCVNASYESIDFDKIEVKNGVVNFHNQVINILHGDFDYLPIQFGEVDNGIFCAEGLGLKSFKGFPTKVTGDTFYVSGYNNKIESLDGITSDVNEITFGKNPIKSLQGIEKKVKRLRRIFVPTSIESYMLGLLKIPELKQISWHGTDPTDELKTAIKILQNNLGKGNAGLIKAQRELLENDLDDYAEM